MIVYIDIRGYSLVVKQQPSKLKTRFRLPLPAFFIFYRLGSQKMSSPVKKTRKATIRDLRLKIGDYISRFRPTYASTILISIPISSKLCILSGSM